MSPSDEQAGLLEEVFSNRHAYESMLVDAYHKASRPSRTLSDFQFRIYYLMYGMGIPSIVFFAWGLSILSLSLIGLGVSFFSATISCWMASKVYSLKANFLFHLEWKALRGIIPKARAIEPYSAMIRNQINEQAVREYSLYLSYGSSYPEMEKLSNLRIAIWFPLFFGSVSIFYQFVFLFSKTDLQHADMSNTFFFIAEIAFALLAFLFRRYVAEIVSLAEQELKSHGIDDRRFFKTCEDNPPSSRSDWMWL